MLPTSLSQISLSLEEDRGSKCGYCGSKKKTSISYGVHCEDLSLSDYQALCDSGWRRSGTYLYALNPEKTCCPALTIRLDTKGFASTKDQRKLVRRFKQFLGGEIEHVQGGKEEGGSGSGSGSGSGGIDGGGGGGSGEKEEEMVTAAEKEDPIAPHLDSLVAEAMKTAFPTFTSKAHPTTRVSSSGGKGLALHGSVPASYTSTVSFQVKAALAKAGEGAASVGEIGARMEQALTPLIVQRQCNGELVVKATPSGHLNFFLPLGHLSIGGTQCTPPAALEKKPMVSKPSPPSSSSSASSSSPPPPPFPKHTWEVKMVPSSTPDPEAFALYRRYQTIVHKESTPPTEESYRRFLCISPLKHVPWGSSSTSTSSTSSSSSGGGGGGGGGGPPTPDKDSPFSKFIALEHQAWVEGEGGGKGLPLVGAPLAAPPPTTSSSSWLVGMPPECVFPDLEGDACLLSQGYGSFHQKYYLDGKLIAVGVVDILPHSLSSVYLFYDPELSKTLPLGKLTALREIQWVQAVSARPCPSPPSTSSSSSAAAAAAAAPLFLSAASPRLKYYYLGYYIDTCPKMRYKADYGPCELLCPVTKAGWCGFEEAKVALASAKCPPLLPKEAMEKWVSEGRLREASLGVSLARAPLILQGRLVGLKDLRDGPGKIALMNALREKWLPLVGAGVGGRALILL